MILPKLITLITSNKDQMRTQKEYFLDYYKFLETSQKHSIICSLIGNKILGTGKHFMYLCNVPHLQKMIHALNKATKNKQITKNFGYSLRPLLVHQTSILMTLELLKVLIKLNQVYLQNLGGHAHIHISRMNKYHTSIPSPWIPPWSAYTIINT